MYGRSQCLLLRILCIVVELYLWCSDEFKRHKAAPSKFLQSFFTAWQDYLKQLELSPSTRVIGADLDATIMSAMSDDQREQLNMLRTEASKLA
jgi:hypothetical protein